MDQIFKFQGRHIYITTFYKMSKVLNKRQPNTVTACAMCTTNPIFIVFNKTPVNQFFIKKSLYISNKMLTIKKSFYYDC